MQPIIAQQQDFPPRPKPIVLTRGEREDFHKRNMRARKFTWSHGWKFDFEEYNPYTDEL